MNKFQIINNASCTLCLNCMKACPNNAISMDNFKLIVNKINQKPSGSIVSCLNCGLCADLCENESHKYVDGKLRYDPTMDTENTTHEIAIDACPINTLHEDEEMFIYDEFNEEEFDNVYGGSSMRQLAEIEYDDFDDSEAIMGTNGGEFTRDTEVITAKSASTLKMAQSNHKIKSEPNTMKNKYPITLSSSVGLMLRKSAMEAIAIEKM